MLNCDNGGQVMEELIGNEVFIEGGQELVNIGWLKGFINNQISEESFRDAVHEGIKHLSNLLSLNEGKIIDDYHILNMQEIAVIFHKASLVYKDKSMISGNDLTIIYNNYYITMDKKEDSFKKKVVGLIIMIMSGIIINTTVNLTTENINEIIVGSRKSDTNGVDILEDNKLKEILYLMEEISIYLEKDSNSKQNSYSLSDYNLNILKEEESWVKVILYNNEDLVIGYVLKSKYIE